jgi:predicted tellurium resistance membrane protein TerC
VPAAARDRTRTIGLLLAMGMRIVLLLSVSWLASLTEPVFTLLDHGFSWRDLILIAGGLFLIWKATTEINEALEGEAAHHVSKGTASVRAVLFQIVLLDIVFSLDSVLTAIGMANDVGVMVIAVVLAVLVMLFVSGPISRFVHEHPTVKMLALAFLLLIGTTLVAEGFGVHVEKAYIYAAMAFSVFVEMLNLVARRRRAKPVEPVELRPTFVKDEPDPAAS